ncbi:MAG: HD-GYP domain-containing protein [Agarilytica sp.]
MPNLIKIPVDQLRIGMVVSKLDRDWLETPFLMQWFEVETHDDVRVLSEYCDHVWVDPDKVPANLNKTQKETEQEAKEYACRVEVEHARIQKEFQAGRIRSAAMHDDVRMGGPIDQQAAKVTVQECVDSVLRNPDALLWMAKIREESAYTAEHSMNVCILAVVFGRHLGLPKEEIELLGLCGLLHDLGKMRVPVEILEKAGKLTTKEMNMMKAHTVHGRNLLLQTPNFDPAIIDAAYSHHERIDGSGYPRKLDAEKISQYARIIGIVDAYDAITANRCYAKARSSTEALRIIYEERGKQFDEDLAVQFIKVIGLFPVGSVVELYNSEVGIVIENNVNRGHLPRVILVLDKDKKRKEHNKIVNLIHIEEGDLSKEYLIKKVLADGEYGVYLRKYEDEGLLLNYQ